MKNKVLITVLAIILLACVFFIGDRMEQNIVYPQEENISIEK